MRRQRQMHGGLLALALAVVWLALAASASPPVSGKVAAAFEVTSDQNATELLDEIVAPSSSTQRHVPPPPQQEQRGLAPARATLPQSSSDAVVAPPPPASALVAVEVTALLVGGATMVVLLLAKINAHKALTQYERDLEDPMLQSLLFNDMDYAAI